jgi:hypothetical protein
VGVSTMIYGCAHTTIKEEDFDSRKTTISHQSQSDPTKEQVSFLRKTSFYRQSTELLEEGFICSLEICD